MQDKKIVKTTRKYALHNAVQFEGTANVKAVMGKVIGVLKEEGYSPKEIIPVVKDVVKNINKKSLKQQSAELKKIAPELLEKEKKQKDSFLPDLPEAKKGEVVTRFPPEPNGYLHIGHAKASIIDYEYAKKYDGKFILRFDDTNPLNADIDFYDAQKEGLKWLGIEWDEEYNTSDNLEKHYELAEKLIKQGDAYVCRCPAEKIKKFRFHGEECKCRSCSCGENIDLWNEMLSSSLENAVLRLKGEMSCDNTAMRDPTLFRVIDEVHPIQGDKYTVWPTYDFAGAVEDSISGVTHPFRTKEYELRDECYFRLLELLDLRKPYLMEFARLSIKGMPISKRKIRPLIQKNLVDGFDDIRLPTLRGLKKRGITAEGIKNFVLSQGISKAESTLTFSLLESANRKIIDPYAKRFFFVRNPVKLKVKRAPHKVARISLHPSNDELGDRQIEVSDTFYVQREDIKKIKAGEIFRLKDLYNVKLKEKKDGKIMGEYEGEELISDSSKIQWTTDDYIQIKIYVPHPLFKNDEYNPDSLEEIEGYAEKAVSSLENGEIIQFERFGFVRIERQNGDIVGFFAHK